MDPHSSHVIIIQVQCHAKNTYLLHPIIHTELVWQYIATKLALHTVCIIGTLEYNFVPLASRPSQNLLLSHTETIVSNPSVVIPNQAMTSMYSEVHDLVCVLRPFISPKFL